MLLESSPVMVAIVPKHLAPPPLTEGEVRTQRRNLGKRCDGEPAIIVALSIGGEPRSTWIIGTARTTRTARCTVADTTTQLDQVA